MVIKKAQSTLDIRVQDAYELMLSLPKHSVDLVLTDPPYGIIDASWDSGLNYESFWQGIHHCAKPNAAILVFGSNKFTIELAASNLKEYRYRFVWDKSGGGYTNVFNSRKMPIFAYEDIVVFYGKLPTYNYQDCMRYGFEPYTRAAYAYKNAKTIGGGCYYVGSHQKVKRISNGERFPINILKYKKERYRDVHATAKPISMLDYLVRMYSNAGELVLDPFVGSGSTAIACVNEGRNFIGGDLSQEFVDVAIQRINEHVVTKELVLEQ